MKLSKAQTQWVKELVSESMTKEHEKLQKKKASLKEFAAALVARHKAEETARLA